MKQLNSSTSWQRLMHQKNREQMTLYRQGVTNSKSMIVPLVHKMSALGKKRVHCGDWVELENERLIQTGQLPLGPIHCQHVQIKTQCCQLFWYFMGRKRSECVWNLPVFKHWWLIFKNAKYSAGQTRHIYVPYLACGQQITTSSRQHHSYDSSCGRWWPCLPRGGWCEGFTGCTHAGTPPTVRDTADRAEPLLKSEWKYSRLTCWLVLHNQLSVRQKDGRRSQTP